MVEPETQILIRKADYDAMLAEIQRLEKLAEAQKPELEKIALSIFEKFTKALRDSATSPAYIQVADFLERRRDRYFEEFFLRKL
jgi:hypothetical protein